MGYSTQDLVVTHGRPLTVDAVREHTAFEGEQEYQIVRRSSVDRYPYLIRKLLLFLFWWKGVDPPGHYHDMGSYDGEGKAVAVYEYWKDRPECKGDSWFIYRKTINEPMSIDRIRAEGLYSLSERHPLVPSEYKVVEKAEYNELIESQEREAQLEAVLHEILPGPLQTCLQRIPQLEEEVRRLKRRMGLVEDEIEGGRVDFDQHSHSAPKS